MSSAAGIGPRASGRAAPAARTPACRPRRVAPIGLRLARSPGRGGRSRPSPQRWWAASSSAARSVDREVPGPGAADRHVAGEREPPARRVDREDRQAVVAAVRAVEEAAVGRRLDLGRVARAREALGQRLDGLDRRELALRRRRSRRRRSCRAELVDHVGVPALRVEREVARAGARGDGGRRRAA